MDHRYLTANGGRTIRDRRVRSGTSIDGNERVDNIERIDSSDLVDRIERIGRNERYHRSSVSREPMVVATPIEVRRGRYHRTGESEIPAEGERVVQ